MRRAFHLRADGERKFEQGARVFIQRSGGMDCRAELVIRGPNGWVFALETLIRFWELWHLTPPCALNSISARSKS
jgi:hypothetical protein